MKTRFFEAIHHAPEARQVMHENLECGSLLPLYRRLCFDCLGTRRKRACALQRVPAFFVFFASLCGGRGGLPHSNRNVFSSSFTFHPSSFRDFPSSFFSVRQNIFYFVYIFFKIISFFPYRLKEGRNFFRTIHFTVKTPESSGSASFINFRNFFIIKFFMI